MIRTGDEITRTTAVNPKAAADMVVSKKVEKSIVLLHGQRWGSAPTRSGLKASCRGSQVSAKRGQSYEVVLATIFDPLSGKFL